MDRETLAYYSDEAQTYAEFIGDADDNPWLLKFMSMLPEGAAVLDFGCGHGWASAVMAARGFDVTPLDGAPGFAGIARDCYGLEMRVQTFEALDDVAAFDGIFASFSLLHDSQAALPGHLARLRRAARPGAVLYLGLKEGEGSGRDDLGRLYYYFGEQELTDALTDAGWGDLTFRRRTAQGLAGKDEAVLHFYAKAV